MDISGSIGILETPPDFEFDIEDHLQAIGTSLLALLAVLLALWAVGDLTPKLYDCARKSPYFNGSRFGLPPPRSRFIEKTALFVYNIMCAAIIFIWAWSSCKIIVGHKAAIHLFGGLAIGIGISLRDFFSSGMVYFILSTSAPFKKGDLMLIRPKYGEQYVGVVSTMGFLHTKLEAVDEHGKPGCSGVQFIQNQMIMSNTVCIFKAEVDECAAWKKFKLWHKSNNLETNTADDTDTGTLINLTDSESTLSHLKYRSHATDKNTIRF